MEIKAIKGRGFKSFREPVEFTFGAENQITGDNYQGKSSIGEMILYALTGVNLEGKAQMEDKLMNDKSKELFVQADIAVDGQEYEIARQVVKQGTKNASTITINGTKATQPKINEIIGDTKRLLAAMLPDYYCQLAPKEAREGLMELLPAVKETQVKERLKKDHPHHYTLLEKISINDAEFFIKTQNTYLKEEEKEIHRLEGAKDEINENLKIEVSEKIEIDDSGIKELEETIKSIEAAKPKLINIGDLERKRQDLLHDYNRLQKGLVFDEKKINCPHCQGEINLSDVDGTQEQENERIAYEMAEITKKGQELKVKIEASKEENIKKQKEFEEQNAETLRELNEKLMRLKENKQRAERHNMQVELAQESKAKAEERAKTIDDEIKKAQERKEECKAKIEAAKQFNLTKLDIQVETVKQHLDKVELILFKVTKSTGEIKPDFKLTYDGREYRVLSTSEKIRCGLEIAHLFRKLTERSYPVFVDNGESITHFTKPDSQLFLTRVVKGQELKVEGEITNE